MKGQETWTCRASMDWVYRAVAEELPRRNRYHRWREVRFQRSDDGGATWFEVPARLCLESRLKVPWFTIWPPAFIDDLRVVGGRLEAWYHDPEYEYEKAVLPFGLDRESIWRAVFLPARSCWRLERIRHLDFEGRDQHLRWEDTRHRPVDGPDEP